MNEEELQEIQIKSRSLHTFLHEQFKKDPDPRIWMTGLCSMITELICLQDKPKEAFEIFRKAVDFMEGTVSSITNDV